MWERSQISSGLVIRLLVLGFFLLALYLLVFGWGFNKNDGNSGYCDSITHTPEEDILTSPTVRSIQTSLSTPAGYRISSSDGLTISLSNSGKIDGVKIDDKALRILSEQGGFSFREVLPAGPSLFGKTVYLNGTLINNHNGTMSQSVRMDDLDFSFTYTPRGRCIEIKGDIQDQRGVDRALQISYNLPVNAEGWRWGDYIRAGRIIRGSTQYENVYVIESWNEREDRPNRTQSVYPFASIDNGVQGLSIAVPMDVPRIYRIGYNLNTGYSIQYDIGLSNQTMRIGKGHASFMFILYKIDEPVWGFRSAVKKYYELYPQFFEKRNTKEGTLNWLFPQHMRVSDNLSDFGLAFDTSTDFVYSSSDSRQLYDLNNGISPLQYTIPWNLPHDFQGITEELTYEEKIAALKADLNSAGSWRGIVSARDAAQVVFNTAPYKQNGSMYLDIPNLRWSISEDKGIVWYPTNPDPDLPSPNRYDISYKKFQMASYKGLELGGMSVDNVMAGWLEHPIENYRIEHQKYTDFPLVFSYSSRKPVILGLFSNYEYMAELRKNMLEQNRLIHANTFPDAYNFFAHLIDILGGETGAAEPDTKDGWDSTDVISSYRRTLSYQKTNINIYTAGWTWKAQRSGTENYIKHSTFYAIFPGSSSGNFFVDSNRDLFKKYIPIIKELSKAGWEPIPYATIDNDNIMLERYGYWDKNNLHYTLRNRADSAQRGTMVIDLGSMGAANTGSIQARELVGDRIINPRIDGKKVVFDISIDPHDTLVVKIG